MPDHTIKIITINTWKSDGDYNRRMMVLTEQLQELAPDIILCQECFALADNSISTVRSLARVLNMHSVFTPARMKKRLIKEQWKESYSGLGILSRFPLVILKEFTFPLVPEDGERKVQIAAVHLPENKKMILVNVHLTHLANIQNLRLEQVRLLVQELLALDSTVLRIVGGDFNAEATSTELALFRTNLRAKDCYTLGGGKVPKGSPNAFQVQKTLDHLFVLPDNSGHYPKFKNSSVVLNHPSTSLNMYASDHPGIMTTVGI